jgi:hypothetical protein
MRPSAAVNVLIAVLVAGVCPVTFAGAELNDNDFAQHVRELKKKLPHNDFTVIIQRPFVVIGDGPPESVAHAAKRQVKWAIDLLKQDFFKREPDEIIDIWLFKDAASYRKHAWEIFGDKPSTPFGYYSARHRALIMNIATGGGTLVHEIVHPFMRTNFPRCPAWFSEGLGSIYEQCREDDGHIHGLTNWRLAGLQKAIVAGSLPSFEKLTATTDEEFYGDDRGTNYAQARYLCYYLQEKGLLVKFYHEFVAHHEDDPTGYKTLQKVVSEADMARFQRKWELFVMKLHFP